jgi:hypothetical protein
VSLVEDPNATHQVDGDPRRSPRRWLAYLALLFAGIGAILVAASSLMPAYTDPIAAERIRSGLECERGVQNENPNQVCDTEVWNHSMNSVRTYKWDLFDFGAGLLASALTLFVFAWRNGQRSWKQTNTPKRSLSILVLASICWLMQIPAYFLFFATEIKRGYHPFWADSLAIPVMATETFVRTLFLPYLVVWLIFVVGGRLPAPVFSKIPGRPVVGVVWTAAAALLFVPIALCLIGAILEGPTLMVPFLWLTLWLVLCVRAAALTRHLPKPEQPRA